MISLQHMLDADCNGKPCHELKPSDVLGRKILLP